MDILGDIGSSNRAAPDFRSASKSFYMIGGGLKNKGPQRKKKEFADAARRMKAVTSPAVKLKSRAPKPGDHVISHHFNHAYFTATIVEFLKDDMSYRIEVCNISKIIVINIVPTQVDKNAR